MSDTLTKESWRSVPGYEGRYEVSDLGRFRAWFNQNGDGKQLDEPRYLKTTKNYAGYHVITLKSSLGEKRQHRAHLLVLAAFIGPRPSREYVGAHHDDDKDNNRLGNLAWKTFSENTVDRTRNGRTATRERHGSYKHGKFIGTNRKYYPPKNLKDLEAVEIGPIR